MRTSSDFPGAIRAIMKEDDCSTPLASLILQTMAHTQGLYPKSDSSLHVLTAPLVVLDTACT